jgi:hypothetical protein
MLLAVPLLDVAMGGAAHCSACISNKWGGGLGEVVTSITVNPPSNFPLCGRPLSGHEYDGGLAPWVLAALRFDGLPVGG